MSGDSERITGNTKVILRVGTKNPVPLYLTPKWLRRTWGHPPNHSTYQGASTGKSF